MAAAIVVLALAGCGPRIDSPVGVWHATGDDSGVLKVSDDGTFTITDASFNPIQYRDADDNFHGSGTWRAFSDSPELILTFDSAVQGDFNVEPHSRSADFTSGTIRFFDPEETMGIEFRLDDPR